MNYIELRNLFKNNCIEVSVAAEIALCVSASVSGLKVDDKEFTAICSYVRAVWDKVEKTYTQLIADVVVDCVYHCFGYYQCNDITLTKDELDNRVLIDEVVQAYLDRYYD